MNDSIEQLMSEWRPRQASPELRRRIFAPEAAAPEPRSIRAADFARWLVPALGCFFMVAATLVNQDPRNVAPSKSWRDQEMAFSIAAHHSGVNSAPARVLEWTFAPASAPGGDSHSPSETNFLTK